MEIKIELTKTPKAKPTDETKLGFGHIFTDHMFVMNYDAGEGWHDARIVPFDNISLSPPQCACTMVRRYLRVLKLTELLTAVFSCSDLTKTTRE